MECQCPISIELTGHCFKDNYINGLLKYTLCVIGSLLSRISWG